MMVNSLLLQVVLPWAKQLFALNVALQVALDGLPVGIFSLEMGADQLANRMISCLAEIPQDNLKTGRLDADQWGRFYNGVQTMKDLQPAY